MCLVCSRREGAEWLKRSVRLKEWERIRAGKQWGPDNVEPQGLCKIFGFWVSEEPGPWTAKRSCLIPGLERFPGGEHGYSVQYCSLENHHGQRSLAGYSPWGHTESATTERSTLSFSFLMSLPPWPHPHPSRSAQSAKLGSLCYIATSHQLSILHQHNIAKQFSSSKKKKKPKCEKSGKVTILFYRPSTQNL